MGTSSIVYTSLPDSTTTCANWNLPSLPSGWQYHCSPTTTLQNTDGTGWIPVNFKTTGVVSLSSLPIDPQNTSSTGLYYTYVTGGSFELTAAFESSKFKLGGDKDIVSTDGGLYPDLYEVGSNLSLQPLDHGDTSLVGYWPLNEGTGTIAYDRSGKGNNGTLVNSPTWVTGSDCGGRGNCLSLNGLNSYVETPKPLTYVGGNMTLSGWVYVHSTESDTGSIISNADMGYNYRITYGGGGKELYFCVNGGGHGGQCIREYHQVLTSDGKWHFFAGVTDTSGNMLLYLDNLVITSGSWSGLVTGWTFADTHPLALGTYYPYGPNWGGATSLTFDGNISGLRIYNRALSASEIQALYNATK
jgi:phage protein U